MKHLIFLTGFFISVQCFGQPFVNRAGQANTVQDARLAAQYNLFTPRYLDTTAANVQKGVDTCGAIIFCYVTNSLWYRQCAPKKWVQFGSGSGGSQTWQQTLLVSNGSLLTQNNDIDVAGYDFRFSSADEFGVGADSIVNTINNSNGKFRIYGSGNLLTALYSGNVGIGTASPSYILDVSGKIGIDGAQVVYRPDQTSFTGSLFYGNGGTNLSHTSGSTGMYNTGSGIYALDSTTTGYFNTAFGANALKNLTTGNSNTAVGVNALISLKSGTENTAVGLNALYLNTADYNTAIGYNALLNNSTGQTNTAIGDNSLLANTTGLQNTSVGYRNLQSNNTGYFNSALGYRAMELNTIGYGNTAIGLHSLSVQTTGFYNTAEGFYSGNSITTGRNNSFFGMYAGNNALQKVDAVNSFAIGSYAYTTYDNQGVIGSKDSTYKLDLYAKDTARVWVNKTTAAITAISSGNVGIGTTSPVYLLHVQGDIGVRGTLSSGSTIQSYTDAQMFFNTRKGAFRAGIATGTQWNNSNVGELSFASGAETIASGNQSTAMGSGSSSTGFYSVAIGENNTASGISAQSIGAYSTSSGDYSYSYGLGLKSKSFAGVAVGQYNDSTNAASSSTNNPNNRAFEVGIGEDNTTRANALTILHSGNVGIGTTTPSTVFHSVGSARFDLGSDATGDMFYRSSSGEFTRLPIGTSGQHLVVVSGLPAWRDTAAAGGGGVTTVGTFSGSSQTNGASISGSTITFGPADATNPGMVTTGTQTFAGAKTFSSNAVINGITAGTYGGDQGFQVTNSKSLYFVTNGTLLNFEAGSAKLQVQIAGAGTYTQGTLVYGGNNGYWRMGSNMQLLGSAGYTSLGAAGTADYLVVASGGNVGVGTTSPHSKLQVSGSFATAYVAKTADYTATASDNIIKVTTSGVTITLPTAVGITGREYVIVNASSGNITVATTSSQNIGNFNVATTLTIPSDGSYVLASDNAGWVIKSKF